MPIRAQCDNCGKVYNLPDESAGKRLRCKQCAVAFTVPAAAAPVAVAAANAPTMASPAAPQKICVVCGQNVAGRPRTKDNAGNYYCRACYEEKARAREQLAQSRVGAAVPVGAGGGGGDDGDMIDLATLEPTEQEQFDESAQPPPPPIPDMDMVAPPLPDMGGEPFMAEPVMVEVPKPKKKKKKKKGAAAAKKTDANSIIATIIGLPFEVWIISLALMIGSAALVNHSLAPQAVVGFIVLGIACILWGHVCCVMAAFQEDTTTGIRYMFFPFYQLFYIISNWGIVQRFVLRQGLGVVLIIAAVGISVKLVKDTFNEFEGRMEEAEKRANKDWSSDPSFKVTVHLDGAPADETEREAQQQQVADLILASFKKRGVAPPEGVKYRVAASVERSASNKQKLSIPINGREMKLPAPMLIYTLEVKDSTDAAIYEQSKEVVLAKDTITKASEEERNATGFIDKQLWKGMIGHFEELAAGMPASGGAAATPSGTDASKTATPGSGTDASKTATPNESPAPAK